MTRSSTVMHGPHAPSEDGFLFSLDRAEAFLRKRFPDLERSGAMLTWPDHQGRSELSIEAVDISLPDGRRVTDLVTLTHTNPRLAAVSVEDAAFLNRYATLSTIVLPGDGTAAKLIARVGVFETDRAAAERVYAPLLCTEATVLGWYTEHLAAHQFSATAEECPLEHMPDGSPFLRDIDPCLKISEGVGYMASPCKGGFTVEFPWDAGAVSHMFRGPLAPALSQGLSTEDIERLGGSTALMTATTTEPHSLYGPGLLVGLQIPVQVRGEDAAEFINALNRWELSEADTPPLFGSWCRGPQGPTFVAFIPSFLGQQIPGVLQNMVIWNQQRTLHLKRRLDALNSRVPAELIRAYKTTEFRVLTDEPFALRIGSRSPELAKAHAEHDADCSAFITACNPDSRALHASANAERHAELIREVAARGLTFVEGIGEDPSGKWPGERSLLVFGLVPKIAREFGAKFGQNAIVWSGADAIPALILLR